LALSVFDLNGFGYPALTLCPSPRRKLNFSLRFCSGHKNISCTYDTEPSNNPTTPWKPAKLPPFRALTFSDSDRAQFLLRPCFILASFLVTQLFRFPFFSFNIIFVEGVEELQQLLQGG